MAAKINMNVLNNKKRKTFKEGNATDRYMVVCTFILGLFTLLLLFYAAMLNIAHCKQPEKIKVNGATRKKHNIAQHA